MSLSSRDLMHRKRSAGPNMSSAGNRKSRIQVSNEDCYQYCLRVGYLNYLLQPRRRVSVAPPPPPPKKSSYSSSAADIMQEFARGSTSSKSTKLPKVDFLTSLQRRLEGVVTGREPNREYNDANIKRTFAVFLNQLMEPRWRGSVNKSRRAEDLILIFVAHATRELTSAVQQGSVAGVSPDNVGLLVDRHVALFIRILLLCLKDNGWASGHPDLVAKLSTLEAKLLVHDQNLAEATRSPTNQQQQAVEEANLTYSVSEMPIVQTTAKVFNIPLSSAQNDINRFRNTWTDAAAVQDLRKYIDNVNLNRKGALRSDDFDVDLGYENWKKDEVRTVSGIIANMVSNNLDLRSVNSSGPSHSPTDSRHYEGSPTSANGHDDGPESSYTYIPPTPRSYFRILLKACLQYDIHYKAESAAAQNENDFLLPILTKDSIALVEECCMRWRILDSSKAVLFLDVMRELYVDDKADLDGIDKSFEYLHKIPTSWTEWTVSDQNVHRKLLAGMYDALTRELYHSIVACFDSKPPTITVVQYVLDNHIYTDPMFTGHNMDQFISHAIEGLKVRAAEVYAGYLDGIPDNREEWDMYHIVELGKKVLELAERMSKKFKRPVLGKIKVTVIAIEVMFPTFAEDAQNLVKGIFKVAEENKTELDMQDAFDMYKKLVEVRDVYGQIIKDKPFPFSPEDVVQEFVVRWINITDSKVIGWVDAAIKEDSFEIGTSSNQGNENSYIDDHRNSSSVSDIFLSFTQAIKTLKDLEWADEFQSARFYTMLSRSIGNGLIHYCEVLEDSFKREMDRLSPEQEAALKKTQKEKFMSYFNSKEKVVPFNFASETCVKFNNIEYALQRLDLLEKTIDVDKCAAIISQNTPVHLQKRQVNNYVFTIKIVEAEDLKACDINGLSDPYVVLGDEFRKRLAKTRVVYSTLNPRFDETVEITTQGPVLLTATIWDFDTVGSHDYVGRSSIKLDPSFFGDYLPREYWLDLDTQGRLLLKVSMEGERDDIQFYFGRTFRTLKRTERDMARQITDKCSAYINHCLSRTTLRSLLSSGITMSSVSSYFSRTGLGGGGARPTSYVGAPASDKEVEDALDPLFEYFNENFQILNQTLTDQAMLNVMSKLWKEVLITIETLLVPPLSDKPSNQRPLQQQEVDIVFKWLKLLFDFFQAMDENGVAQGVQPEVLKSPKYHDLQSISFFYNEPSESLIRTSERMAAATNQRQQQQQQKPANLGVPGSGALLHGLPAAKRSKSVLMNRNLGTMRRAKEEKRKEAQAEPSDDMILRILRMRPEATGYLRARSQQKERIEAQRAAEAIVQASINAGAGRMTSGYNPRR